MKPIDLHAIKTFPLAERPSKVNLGDLGKLQQSYQAMKPFFENLPHQFGAVSFRKLRDHLLRCQRDKRWAAAAIGGHVIKVGCSPYLIDWMDLGIIKSLAMNGSAAIHDVELAIAGKTSEDVAPQLKKGEFGMAMETAAAFAGAVKTCTTDVGLGNALGRWIDENNCPNKQASVVWQAYRLGVPCTIHVALGTDIVHMHPHVDGAALGLGSMTDFRIICAIVNQMQEGLWLNIGSAVVMPEVFLKAVAVAANLGADLSGLITANMDKEAKYRTRMNVLSRPSAEGIELIGHHEINLPLLHAAVRAELDPSWNNSFPLFH
ncbi:MAG: hypothetical protein R3B84_01205 [Zavarzinella sp.]